MPKKIKVNWKNAAVVGATAISLMLSASAIAAVSKQEKTVEVGWTKYQVAGLTEEGKIDTSIKETIVSDLLNIKGLAVDVEDDANLSFSVRYYDKNKQYMSEATSTEYTDDFTVEEVEGAESVRFVITAKSDEDGEITYVEMLKYLSQFTASLDK